MRNDVAVWIWRLNKAIGITMDHFSETLALISAVYMYIEQNRNTLQWKSIIIFFLSSCHLHISWLRVVQASADQMEPAEMGPSLNDSL